MLTQKRKRITLAITGFIVLCFIVVLSTHPIMGMEADGGVLGREVIATIRDSEGHPVSGITVREVHESTRSGSVKSKWPLLARNEPDGRLRFGAGFHGTSSSTYFYCLGLWGWRKYSGAGEYGKELSLFWGLKKLDIEKATSFYVFYRDGNEVARISEAQLLRAPVSSRIPLADSLFADEPNAPYFVRNKKVEVSELTLQAE